MTILSGLFLRDDELLNQNRKKEKLDVKKDKPSGEFPKSYEPPRSGGPLEVEDHLEVMVNPQEE